MRTLVLAIALLGLMFSPSALAGSTAAPPAVVTAVYHDDGTTTLAWTPVRGASGYAIFAGDDPDSLVKVGETEDTVFHLQGEPASPYFGVATLTSEGQVSDPHIISSHGTGDCVSTSTELSFGVSLRHCLALVP